MEENMKRQEDNDQPLTCPVDRQVLDRDQDIFPDEAAKRKILSFFIKCPSEGCEWTGELRNKKDHLASCLFKIVPCTNKSCAKNVRRKDLDVHVTFKCQWTKEKCDYCYVSRPKCQMKGHIGHCRKYPVACPNACGESVNREMIPNHTKNDCPLELISCPYEQIGCEIKVPRQEVESHLQSDMKPHLDLACVRLTETEVKLNYTEIELRETQEKLETRIAVWRIENFREILRKAKTRQTTRIERAPFYTNRTESYGYKLKVGICPNGYGSGKNTHLSMYVVVMKGEYDAILPWPFKKKVKFTLIDQQEDPFQHENVTENLNPANLDKFAARPSSEQNPGMGIPKFISHEELHSRRYLVDDTLFLHIEVGPSCSRS